jgi:hypothetical protein
MAIVRPLYVAPTQSMWNIQILKIKCYVEGAATDDNIFCRFGGSSKHLVFISHQISRHAGAVDISHHK